MFKKLKDWWKAAEQPASPYQEALLRLQRSSSPGVRVFGDVSRIAVLVKTIDQYTAYIQNAIRCLEEDIFFKHPEEAIGVKTISRKAFYLSKNGEYLNVDEEHTSFVHHARYLLELYERESEKTDQNAVRTNNLYRILPVVNNLISLSSQITDDLP